VDINVNPYIIKLGFLDLLFKCINSAIKNKVKFVAATVSRNGVSIDTIFPIIKTMIVVKVNKNKVFMSCSAHKSSGSINSSGDFFLIISFNILSISLSISVMIFPL